MSANQSPERFQSATKLVNSCNECLADDTRPCVCISYDRTNQDLVCRLLAGRIRAAKRKTDRAKRLAYARTFKNPFLRKKCAVRIQAFFRGYSGRMATANYKCAEDVLIQLGTQAAVLERLFKTPERQCEVCFERVSSHLTDCPVINQPTMLCWEFCNRRLFCTDRNRCDIIAAQKYKIAKGFLTPV